MRLSRKQITWVTGFLLVFPSLGFLLIFYYYPIFYSVYLSLVNWNLLSPIKDFVGFLNFSELIEDPYFIMTVRNSINFTIGVVSISLIIGLALAVALSRPSKTNSFFRALYFTPYIISWVSISLLWTFIFDADWGLINTILHVFHIPRVRWLDEPKIALFSLVLVMVWKVIGYNMVIFLAGLRNIPDTYYEAADIDGASRWNQFRYISFPLLTPTLLFLLVTSIITSFTAFTVVKVMTGGGPVHATSVFVYYIYEVAFEYFKIGKASAGVLVFFLMIIALTLLQFLGLRRRIHYER